MPDESSFKDNLLDRLKAIGAGLVTFAPGGLAADMLARVLTGKGGGSMPPLIKETKVVKFPEKAFGKSEATDKLIINVAPGLGASSGRDIRLHSEKGKVSLPALAHELGHSMGGPVQKVTQLSEYLFHRPRIDGKTLPLTVSPLHLPLLLAATSPVGKDESGIWAWIKRHPAALAAMMSSMPLAGEAHASIRGLHAINKVYGPWKAIQSAGPMARNFAATAASHLPAIIALYASSKIRDWLRREEPEETEKKAGATGWVTRAMDRPLLGGERIVPRHEEGHFPVDPAQFARTKKMKLRPDEERPAIQQSNTRSGSLGVQE